MPNKAHRLEISKDNEDYLFRFNGTSDDPDDLDLYGDCNKIYGKNFNTTDIDEYQLYEMSIVGLALGDNSFILLDCDKATEAFIKKYQDTKDGLPLPKIMPYRCGGLKEAKLFILTEECGYYTYDDACVLVDVANHTIVADGDFAENALYEDIIEMTKNGKQPVYIGDEYSYNEMIKEMTLNGEFD